MVLVMRERGNIGAEGMRYNVGVCVCAVLVIWDFVVFIGWRGLRDSGRALYGVEWGSFRV